MVRKIKGEDTQELIKKDAQELIKGDGQELIMGDEDDIEDDTFEASELL
jgi:hypothetical protein